jgi:hypothetical protein
MSGRCGIFGVGLGRAMGLDRKTERKRIIASFDVLNVPPDLRSLVVEALDSNAWDWFCRWWPTSILIIGWLW